MLKPNPFLRKVSASNAFAAFFYAIAFLIVAIAAGLLGQAFLSGIAAVIAQICLLAFVFLIIVPLLSERSGQDDFK